MDAIELILKAPAYAALIILYMWNRDLQARLDRIQERQNELFKRALSKTDLREDD